MIIYAFYMVSEFQVSLKISFVNTTTVTIFLETTIKSLDKNNQFIKLLIWGLKMN